MRFITSLLLLSISTLSTAERLLEETSWTDSFKDFFKDDACLRTEKNTENLLDLSNWMSKLENANELRLLDLTFPGTHNSGSYDLTTQVNEADPLYQVVKSGTFEIPEEYVAQWMCKYALTQSLSLSEQLQAGIRYFDLRLDYDPATESFRNSHMLYGLGALELLEQIATFAKNHTKEIIILELLPLEAGADLALETKTDLQRKITNVFAGNLIPSSIELQNITVGELQESGTNVMVIAHDDEIVGDLDTIWHNKIVENTFAETVDIDKLIDYNNLALFTFSQNRTEFDFYKIQWILTPDKDYIQANPLEGSLFELAKDVNEKMGELRKSSSPTLLGNILMVDYVETSPLMQLLGYDKYSDGEFEPEPTPEQSMWTGAAKAGVGIGVLFFLCGCFCLCKFCRDRDKEEKE
jgi:hypothetical protein